MKKWKIGRLGSCPEPSLHIHHLDTNTSIQCITDGDVRTAASKGTLERSFAIISLYAMHHHQNDNVLPMVKVLFASNVVRFMQNRIELLTANAESTVLQYISIIWEMIFSNVKNWSVVFQSRLILDLLDRTVRARNVLQISRNTWKRNIMDGYVKKAAGNRIQREKQWNIVSASYATCVANMFTT